MDLQRGHGRVLPGQQGMALITVMMVMMLVSALMVAFVAAIVADNRASGLDRDQTQAYAAAHAGLEKLTSDLFGLFTTDFSPNATQVNGLMATPPAVTNFQYTAPDGTSGYLIRFPPDPVTGDPAPEDPEGTIISAGPYQGFRGIITPYDLTVTARSGSGAEVRIRRTLQTIAVPVFQFGMFCESDCSFFAGPDFSFGGRVHTNANLYLAQGNGTTLGMSDRVTAVGEVIRTNLSNGWPVTSNYNGTVNLLRAAPSTFRALAPTEGSLVGTLGSAQNEPTWTDLSIGNYVGNVRNGRTGARRLDLPLVSQGAVPIDLIRRPEQNSNESVASPLVYRQRFFSQAALRILLSDTPAAITTLPTVTATAPVPLDGTATAAQYGPVDATRAPMALAAAPATTTTSGNTTFVASPGTVTITTVAGGTAPFAPVLRVGASTVTCTGRTASTFTGCTGTPVSLTGTAVTSGTVSTVTLLPTLLNATTITVAPNGALPFAPLPFFWNDSPISCTGYTTSSFTECTGPVTPAMPGGSVLTTASLAAAGQPLLNGFIKIERQSAAGVWTDVTTEILNLGITATNDGGAACATPNANTTIVKLQRLRDNGGLCDYAGSIKPTDYWPQGLYDTREGLQRDSIAVASNAIALGGIMQYVELDVNNLRRWFSGAIAGTGTQAKNENGYIVYFSDRRNNRNAAGNETGEYGFEDVVNPVDVNGVPNDALDTGEDSGGLDPVTGKPVTPTPARSGNGVLETYGQTPQNLPTGALAPYTAAARPNSTTVGLVAITSAHARVNRQILFRRALVLVNGGIVGGVNSLPPGFTVTAENPVYVLGNYNAAPTDTLAEPHVPAAVIADSVTLLSSAWSDVRSFENPNSPGARPAATTGYRMAIAAGKHPAFPRPAAWAADQDFGTDGGAHNFLRYLENWGGEELNYRGSIISFFFSRQAIGTYKCCTNVYGPPSRGYNFDSDFLLPALLPPGTPMFRDINTLTFRQLLRPNQ